MGREVWLLHLAAAQPHRFAEQRSQGLLAMLATPRTQSKRRQLGFCVLGCIVLFMATNSTFGHLWRASKGCVMTEIAKQLDGEYHVTRSLHTLEHTLGMPKIRATLDIGANNGDWAMKVWKDNPGMKVFMLEANMALEPSLKQVSKITGNAYRMAVVGDVEKEVEFNIMCEKDAPCAGGSSVFAETTGWGVGKEKRHMTTVDKLVADAGVGPFQMIKIDVQGAEKIALKGATKTLRNVNVILLETSNVEYNKGAPQTLEVLNFMDSIGFQIFDIVELHRKKKSTDLPGGGVLFQVDFVFVRKGSHIARNIDKLVQSEG